MTVDRGSLGRSIGVQALKRAHHFRHSAVFCVARPRHLWVAPRCSLQGWIPAGAKKKKPPHDDGWTLQTTTF
jgi:hypothetical protein